MAQRTVLQLLVAAAEELEVIDSGGSLTTAEQASGLDRYNRMVDASSADPALIFTERLTSLALTSGQQTYTIGIDPAGLVTADYAITRPSKITRANLFISDDVRRELAILTAADYAQISLTDISGPPTALYNDEAFISGLSTLRFDRNPDQTYDWEFYSWQQNGQAAAVSTAIDYPPAYAEYWLYAMAIRLAPMFGRAVSPDLRESFRQARSVVVAKNSKTPMMRPDESLASGEVYQDWRVGPFGE